MALTSPGVEVTVIDESFYTPAAPGTVPLILLATGQDKSNVSGTGVAQGTLRANAGRAFRITSQKELVDFFGTPFFEKTVSNTPIHGSERNEYGLLAAYSLLGVNNSVFIVRADVDLDSLDPTAEAPGAEPADGTWWLDTQTSAWGLQEWNGNSRSTTGGQRFSTKFPLLLTDDDESRVHDGATAPVGTKGFPRDSVGAIGDYVIVAQTVDGTGTFDSDRELIRVFYKSPGLTTNLGTPVPAGEWVLVGSNDWSLSWPTIIGASTVGTLTAGHSFYINQTLITLTGTTLTTLVADINGLVNSDGVYAKEVSGKLYLYTDGTSISEGSGDSSGADGAILIEQGSGTVLTTVGITAGKYVGPRLQLSAHTSVPEWKSTDTSPAPTGSLWVKTTEPNAGARLRFKRYNTNIDAFTNVEAPIYASTNDALYFLDRVGGGTNLPVNSLFVQYNATENSGFDVSPTTAEFRAWRRAVAGNTVVTSVEIGAATLVSGGNTITIAESLSGTQALGTATTVSFTATATAADASVMAAAINAAGFTHVVAAVTDQNEIQLIHKTSGDVRITDGTNTPAGRLFTPYNINTNLGDANFYSLASLAPGASQTYLISNWQPLAASNFQASGDAPTDTPADGKLWYNVNFSEVDIMYHNGRTWVGYQHSTAYPSSNPTGPIVSATEPTEQTDFTALVEGDLWISTANLENFPTIYRWNSDDLVWVLVDKSDQITEDGILFADARYGSSGTTGDTAAEITTLLSSNYLDPDAPDPALYPKGMLLWNLRRSGGNVKRFIRGYITELGLDDNPRFDATNSVNGDTFVSGQSMDSYAVNRWVTASGNNEDGSGSFGRKAQRKVVVEGMKSAVDTSQEIRDLERRNFNLIAAPGYPELMQNMINLNTDRRLTSFVVGDSPLRLSADTTSMLNWASNANLALDNGEDGMVSYDEYLAVYYPSGFTTDLSGVNAVVPSSYMMLRTITLSDNVSYPWFAPAGTRRGGITNATSVGFIDVSTGEFQTVALNEGQRDTLYEQKVNPIVFFNGVGHVAFGQKSRARNASALDRINVARLVVYLRTQLDRLARPFIFEPNDKITRDEIKQAVESLLLELAGLRAIFDFAVVCDESNNTPARIDRNELYVDIAIEPTKAVEFIYIPLRVRNTGEI